jgi:hypothetical protein
LRAIRKIGELSRELDKAKPGPKDNGDRSPKTKAAALKQAGIPVRTANDYEKLAGPREQQAQQAPDAAADLYFAEQQEKAEPVTTTGLKTAIETALVQTLGEPPKRRKKSREEIDHRFIHFIGPIRDFQRKREEYDAAFFAEEELEFVAPTKWEFGLISTDISARQSSRRAQKVRERSNPQRQTYPRCDLVPYILFRLVSDNFPSRNLGRLWKQRGHFLPHVIRSQLV